MENRKFFFSLLNQDTRKFIWFYRRSTERSQFLHNSLFSARLDAFSLSGDEIVRAHEKDITFSPSAFAVAISLDRLTGLSYYGTYVSPDKKIWLYERVIGVGGSTHDSLGAFSFISFSFDKVRRRLVRDTTSDFNILPAQRAVEPVGIFGVGNDVWVFTRETTAYARAFTYNPSDAANRFTRNSSADVLRTTPQSQGRNRQNYRATAYLGDRAWGFYGSNNPGGSISDRAQGFSYSNGSLSLNSANRSVAELAYQDGLFLSKERGWVLFQLFSTSRLRPATIDPVDQILVSSLADNDITLGPHFYRLGFIT